MKTLDPFDVCVQNWENNNNLCVPYITCSSSMSLELILLAPVRRKQNQERGNCLNLRIYCCFIFVMFPTKNSEITSEVQ